MAVARSTGMINGMAKRFPSVIGVRTKPGLMTRTRSPSRASPGTNDSAMLSRAALDAP